ncbi:unnamed protein product [Cuscuta epithymum]|uniref:CCHC-type domain-containing protein n=1 Tax=Cuscuta epithymum TaxID=186058 RepID=A0AAV0EG64_9ASTE|nr:unnamed protein product [Cuscuta epithymum]
MPPRRDPNAVPTNAELAQALTQLTQTINVAFQNQPNNGNNMESRVAARNPPNFLGQEDPVLLENWIRTFDKLFDVINCPAEQRINIAVYYLHGEADKWWAHVGAGLSAQPDFTWERFKRALRKRFYPPHVQAENYDKFLHLKQGEMTVQEYHSQFVTLSEFATSLVPDEESKIEKFIGGLNFDTQKIVTVQEWQTLDDVYYKAAKHYRVIQLQREVHKKRKHEEENRQGEKRVRVHHHAEPTHHRPRDERRFQGHDQRRDRRNMVERHFNCTKCKKDHPGVDCAGNRVKCFTCGKMGHRAFECWDNVGRGPQNQGPNRGGGSQGGGNSSGAENRGNNNPGNQVGNGNRGQNQNQGRGNNNNNNAPNQGRIYVMNQAQARAHDVVSGDYLETGIDEKN